MLIESRRNPRVLALQKQIRSSRDLRAAGLCVLEGAHLIAQYVARYGPVETQICAVGTKAGFEANETLMVPSALMTGLSELASPPDIIAVARVPSQAEQRVKLALKVPTAQLFSVLALDDVQDPGNVGTLLRTAAAVGISEVWLSAGCANPWSQKVLRASQGAQFETAVCDNIVLAIALRGFTGEVAATSLAQTGSRSLFETKFSRTPTAFVVGNEGAGVSDPVMQCATLRLQIPMNPAVESLNVGAATAVVLYEWARQCQSIR